MANVMKFCVGFQSKLHLAARISLPAQKLMNVSYFEGDQSQPPISGYKHYLREKITQLLQEDPSLGGKGAFTKAASSWKYCSAEERQYYEDKYKEQYEEYSKNLKNHPKPPGNMYTQFFNEKFKLLKSQYISQQELAKRIGEMWRELPDDEKSRYKQIADQLKNEYRETVSDETLEFHKHKRELRKLRKERQNIKKFGKEVWKSRPAVPRPNSFIQFMTERREAAGEHLTRDKLHQEWNQLSDEEKSEYRRRSVLAVEDRRDAYNQWYKENTPS